MMKDIFTRNSSNERHKGIRFGTLWYSHGRESGDVTLVGDFHEYDNLMRLDILKDVIGLLEGEYEETLKEFNKEMEEIAEKARKRNTHNDTI